ncbi:MAG: sigma 54-interacting transcriptional regulator [Myxococcales bacterium]|nr:sigma 54-interacting transcriptional regulator [Myxococcales bacterium]
MTDLEERTIRPPAKRRARRQVRARLTLVHPPRLAMHIALTAEPLSLGRNPPGEAPPIADPTVSRKHLELEWDRGLGQHVVADAGSENGSWCDGTKLEHGRRVVLPDGAVLRLGEVLFVYEAEAPPDGDDGAGVSRDAIPGDAALVQRMRASVGRAAADPSPVLLIGETGTGKELTAREVHRLSGRRGPLLAVNCAELSEQLIESQLFGHVRGAFTGADQAKDGLFRAAQGGTLFLDEIGELPLALQPKLLRALQEREVLPVGATRTVSVDTRVIAATNRDLSQQVEQEAFRRDLYARLSLWEIRVPALRERRVDLLGWVQLFHRKWLEARDREGEPLRFDADAAEAILLHPWPNNLRGIDRLVHQLAAADVGQDEITLYDLEPYMPTGSEALLPVFDGSARGKRASGGSAAVGAAAPADDDDDDDDDGAAGKQPAPKTREELERVMAEHDNSVRAVAKHYGRDRRQIYRWLDKFGLR